LYRDGEEVASGTIAPNDLSHPEYTLYFGSIRGCGNESSNHLNGSIAEVVFFNGAALSISDIDKIMNEGMASLMAVSSTGKPINTWTTLKIQD